MSMRSSWLACALAPMSALAAQGKVWVVDDQPGPGVDFTKIQQAVHAAAEGDTVLVRSGTYQKGGAMIAAKSLTIAADAGATVKIVGLQWEGQLRVTDLAAAQRVTIQGIQCEVWADGNQGLIWLEDCVGPVVAHASAAIVARDCAFRGKAGQSFLGTAGFATSGGAGISLTDSNMSAFGCRAAGGEGGVAWDVLECDVDGDGGHGAWVQSSVLLADRCKFEGGFAGYGYSTLGGNGLLAGPGSLVSLIGCIAVGGLGGGCPALGTIGAVAPAIVEQPHGQVVQQPGQLPEVHATSPLREGELVPLTFAGAPGDAVLAMVSLAPSHAVLDGIAGVLGLALPIATFGAGPLGPAGTASVSFVLQDLGPGVEGLTAYVQALFVSSSAAPALGEPTSLLLLDAAF